MVGPGGEEPVSGALTPTDAYCLIRLGEIFLMNSDIEPYEQASVFQHERRRDRKLLMHRKEIEVLDRKSMEKGLALILLAPLFQGRESEGQRGPNRGKALYDKRDKKLRRTTRDERRNEFARTGSIRRGRLRTPSPLGPS